MEGPEFYRAVGGLIKRKVKKGDVEEVADLERFKQIVAKLDVMARSRPEDKYLLVAGLR